MDSRRRRTDQGANLTAHSGHEGAAMEPDRSSAQILAFAHRRPAAAAAAVEWLFRFLHSTARAAAEPQKSELDVAPAASTGRSPPSPPPPSSTPAPTTS